VIYFGDTCCLVLFSSTRKNDETLLKKWEKIIAKGTRDHTREEAG
jgi:hypothetical protein